MPNDLPTQEDRPANYRRIAEVCGVGKTTVGRVFQKSGFVSEETRRKVTEAAERLGYRPDPSLGALSRRRWPKGAKPHTATLAWLHQPAAEEGAHLSPEFLGARQRATELGYQLDDFRLGEYRSAAALSRVIYHRGIRGVLVQAFRDGILLELDWPNFFTIFVGPENDLAKVHNVQADFRSALHQGTLECLKAGYRKIGFALMNYQASGTDVPFHAQALFERERLESTLGPQPPVFHYQPGERDFRNFRTWMRDEKPEVIVSTNVQPYYWLAASPHYDRRSRIWKIPEDVGFLCLRQSQDVPGLAHMDLRLFEQGRQAVDLAHQQLQHGQVGIPSIPLRLLVPPVFVPGKTLRERPAKRSFSAR